MTEQYGGSLKHVGQAYAKPGSGLGLDGVDVREAIPEIFHGLEDAGMSIAGLGNITVDGDSIRIYVPLDHGVPCAPTADAPADGGLWIRATRVHVDHGEIRWYVAMHVGDLVHNMYVGHATTNWTHDQQIAALDGRPDEPSSYNDPGVRDRLMDTQPASLRDAATMAADRLGIGDGAVTSAVDVTAQHRRRMEIAAVARDAATARAAASQPAADHAGDDDGDGSGAGSGAGTTVDQVPRDDTDRDSPDTGADDDVEDLSEPPAPSEVGRPMVSQRGVVEAPGPTVDLAAGATFGTSPLELKDRYGFDTDRYDDGRLLAQVEAGLITGDAAIMAIDMMFEAIAGGTAVIPESDPRLDALGRLMQAREGLAPPADVDTGHYDDGHSFGWNPPPEKSWKLLTTDQTAFDLLVADVEARMNLEAQEAADAGAADGSTTTAPPPAPPADGRGKKRVLVAGGIFAVLLLAAVAIVAIGGGGGGDSKKSADNVQTAPDDDSRSSEEAPLATPLTVAYGTATIVSSEYNPPRTSTVTETPPTLQVECSRTACTLLFRGTRIPGRNGVFSTTVDESPVAQTNCPPDRRYTDTFDVRSTGTIERQGIKFPAKLSGTVTRSIPRVDVALANGSTICFGQTTVYSIDAAPSA